jgi:hypothetical protein
MSTGFWWGKLRDRDHWSDADVDGTIILRWIAGSDVHGVLEGKTE